MLLERLVDGAGDQLLRHVLLHVVAEVPFHQPPRDVAGAVPPELHRARKTRVRAVERVLHPVRSQLDRDLLDDRREILDTGLGHDTLLP